MDLTIIAAISENNVIGHQGNIPWRIKEDMKRFKELTTNHPVIMGRKTYESIPKKFRPLPQRQNIILSRSFETDEEIYIARSIEEALAIASDRDSYIMGGEAIYDSFLPYANKMELTRVHNRYEGDAFFPEVDWNEWELLNQEKKKGKGVDYSFLTYSRIKI